MRNNCKGFTLIEIFIATVFILILGILAFNVFRGVTGWTQTAGFTGKTTTDLASETILSRLPDVIRRDTVIVSSICDTHDSDNNGRVRCTVSYMPRGNTSVDNLTMEHLECPASLSLNTTCVPMRPDVRW